MPDLTLSVTAAQSTRIRTALGTTDENGDPVLASADDVTAAIKAYLKRQVFVYEKNKADATSRTTIDTGLDDEGWNA